MHCQKSVKRRAYKSDNIWIFLSHNLQLKINHFRRKWSINHLNTSLITIKVYLPNMLHFAYSFLFKKFYLKIYSIKKILQKLFLQKEFSPSERSLEMTPIAKELKKQVRWISICYIFIRYCQRKNFYALVNALWLC